MPSGNVRAYHPSILTITKTARELGVTRYLVRRMIEAGDLATVELAGRTFVLADSAAATADALDCKRETLRVAIA